MTAYAGGPAWQGVGNGVVLAVRLTPKASREAIDGIGRLSDGQAAVVARVTAAPADGAANKALCRLMAKTLRVPNSAVTVIAGHTARLKRVRIDGNPAILTEAIARWPDIS